MAQRCAAITKKGRCCTINADPDSSYCHVHRSDGKYQRQLAVRRAGEQAPLEFADESDGDRALGSAEGSTAVQVPADRSARAAGSPVPGSVARQPGRWAKPASRANGSGPQTGVFTDGSCSPNPGPGGWGFVWVVDGHIKIASSGQEIDTTNNRMELTALIEAFRVLPSDAEVTVYTDSNLCVQTLTEWAPKWEAQGWPARKKNLDLVRPALALLRARPGCRLEWIKAHVGYRWNEYADGLATAWMRES